MNHKVLQRYFLIFIGLLFIGFFIWFKLLRTRVPRDLPFTLLVLSFLLIFCSTCLYIYAILGLYYPSKNTKISKEIYTFFMTPLREVHTFITQFISLEEMLMPVYNKINNVYVFYFFTNILPRIITVTILLLDIFLFGKLHYLYNIIYITVIPLFTRYFIFCLTNIKDLWVINYEPEIRPIKTLYVMGIHPDEWPENQTEDSEDYEIFPDFMNLSIEIFINYQINCILFDDGPVEYHVFHTNESFTKYKKMFGVTELTSIHYEQIQKEAKTHIEKFLQLALFIYKYQNAYILHKYFRDIKAIIYFLYFLCWSYMMYICASKVLWVTGLMSLINALYMMEDPFSGELIYEELIRYIKENADMFIIKVLPKTAEKNE